MFGNTCNVQHIIADVTILDSRSAPDVPPPRSGRSAGSPGRCTLCRRRRCSPQNRPPDSRAGSRRFRPFSELKRRGLLIQGNWAQPQEL